MRFVGPKDTHPPQPVQRFSLEGHLFSGFTLMFAAINQVCTAALPIAVLLVWTTAALRGETPVDRAAADPASSSFSTEVAPLLERHCLRCHGPDREEGGLRLDSAANLQRGGDSGPAVQAGRPEQSELLRRVESPESEERMPQAGERLSDEEIARLRDWIANGAGWPAGRVLQDISRRHWSFQPIQRPPVPGGIGHSERGARNEIDAFVLDRLQRAGLSASAESDRVTLVRRVSLDLIGLPPTPDEVDAFVGDSRPDAFERLVERLLASPYYGEKWARPWLDLCHFAESDGYLTDQLRPVAWRYRQWLIDALNQNKPFDRFTIEQLAGDLLPGTTHQQRIATGFLRQTLSNREGGADLEEFRVKQVVDRTSMVGSVWLGLTVGCARCHDHKYDPLTQAEFFRLYGCLNNADEVNIDAPLPGERTAFFASRDEYRRRRLALTAPLRSQIDELQRSWEARILDAYRNPGRNHTWDRQWELLGLIWGGGLGEGQLEGTEIVKLPWDKRTWRQKEDLLDYFLSRGALIGADRFKELKLAELSKQLDALKKEFPPATRAPTIQAALNPRSTYIHVRGEFRARGAEVQPGTPGCLPAWKASSDPPRLALARWLVSGEHPLTARVTINRMWQEFFGRGLVMTSEDFGTRGDHPSHPLLLDWLASRFMDSGWDVKDLHRLIVTSATYRQSSRPRPDLVTLDPANVLLARQASLRVPAETVRDLGLAASGLLSRRIGGPSVKPPQPERVTMEAFGNNKWEPSEGADRYRRGLYTVILRASPFAQSTTFDAPNPNEICTRRDRSNTPLQALTLLNDPVFFEMAEGLAARVLNECSGSDEQRIDYAFRLCCGRNPQPAEQARLASYLHQQYSQDGGSGVVKSDRFGGHIPPRTAAAWTSLCSVLLNLHEFITRD